MTDPIVADSERGEIPATIEIDDSPSVSSDGAIASSITKVTESVVSPLRSGSIGTAPKEEHGLMESIRKQVEKQSGMETIRDPPAYTHRLSEFTNEYPNAAEHEKGDQGIVVEAIAVILEPIKLIDTEDVDVVQTDDGAEVTLSPSYESRNVKGEERKVRDPPSAEINAASPDAIDDPNGMKEQAMKLIEQYGKEGEVMLLASLEAEANAKAAVARQMLAALEEEVIASAQAAETAILRATQALEAIKNSKSSHPTDAVESNIAATIALAELERSGKMPIPQAAADAENRERGPEVESINSVSKSNELSSQVTVEDGNKIRDPPVIIRRTAIPSEEDVTNDPPVDVSEISCLPSPPEGELEKEMQPTSHFPNDVAVDGTDNADIIEGVNQDSTPATDMEREVDNVPAMGGTPGRIAKAHVDDRISQIDTSDLIFEQEDKNKMPKPTPENESGHPLSHATRYLAATVVPAVVTTTLGTLTLSHDDSMDDDLTKSPSSTSRLSTIGTLETIYRKIDECRVKISDPNTSQADQLASAALMEKLARVAVSFKAVEEMDRC
jgi:hypothetical protein